MYRVIIVDDETIILAGIKFMVDWEKNDCMVTATARNGQDALEQIRKSQPDIVLADINMPVMDGIELIKRVQEEFPHIVFIILTNLEEFELARQALKYHVVDYLIKSKLDTQALEKVLEHAKTERNKRGRIIAADAADYFAEKKQREVIDKALQEVVFLQKNRLDRKYIKVLYESDMLSGYAYFYIPLHFFAVTGEEMLGKKEKTERLRWIRELAEKTSANAFHKNYILLNTGEMNALILFVHHISEKDWKEKQEIFERKLSNTIKNITKIECAVYHTNVHNGYTELNACASEYQAILECHYLGIPENKYRGGDYDALGLNGIGAQLGVEIMRRNMKGIHKLLDGAQSRIQSTYHQKSQAMWLLNELNREAASVLAKLGIMEKYSYDRVINISAIENIMTREQVLDWLQIFRNTLEDMLGSSQIPRNLLAKKAYNYVLDHIESRIGLQEAAEYVGVSKGYLSIIFKREYGQNFIDFINRTKIEHACLLLEKKELMVMEIAYRLGYENAYYFSKVFRKYMGMSPTDYQKMKIK